jgi:hypothetical protein
MSGREVATRELDAEVADRVMGWTLATNNAWPPESSTYCNHPTCGLLIAEYRGFNGYVWTEWQPSKCMNAAMQVVEAMRRRGYWFKMNYGYIGDPIGYVYFDEKDWADPNPMYFERYEGIEQLPAAICRCALAALSALEGRDGSV